ncbi:MAG: 6,7-dimethyl-8-ribityllumazine synthase [Bacteroidia bacterium]|nr:MAG: 6,7-dimethyl-8-ribityllumazine synthase [Bacteroidia bacterium]
MTTRPTDHTTPSAAIRGARLAVVASKFNSAITESLLAGAMECLRQKGIEAKVSVYRCPGAFELPQVAERLASGGRWDAIICLGAVIRGETPHFEYVAHQSAAGIQQTALRHGVPVIFGVLTTDNELQAKERAGGRLGNKGWDAAVAALEMIALFRSLPKRRGKR